MARKSKSEDAKKLLLELRDRYKSASEADHTNRQKSLADVKFCTVPGEQWDQITKNERGQERPMYEFNKVRISVKRVVNDMRSNRPQGKVRAFEDNDKDTAETIEGLCRNIWNCSDGDSAIDAAAEYQVMGGMGAWRVNTKYSTDEAFDQDIVIEPIRNPYCLYADPACHDMLKRDADFWILTTEISRRSFEAKYPNAKPVDFEGSEFDDEEDWKNEERVRICEYWYKVPVTKQIALLADGQTVDLSAGVPQGVQVLRQREVQGYKIQMCIASGDSILEGPTDWAGSQFPFVIIYGDHLVVDGKTTWFGLVRFAKDAQRSYNFARTAIAETIALAPQAKFWATPEQAKGNLDKWAEAHKKNYPVMLYNPDGKAAGPPTRMGGADVPIALIQEAQIASDEIKAVTGIFDASLGNRSNEQTGVAIRARQAQGEISTFNYMDNMAKGIRRTWEILIDLIPKIYDTERAVRILGQDGAEKYARLNSMDPVTGETVNDLARGKYDVTITVGPSYATQRQEAVEAYTQIGATQPALYQVAGDVIFRNMDLPGAEQIAERLKAMLPPQIQQAEQDGKPVPPEIQAAMAQAQQAMQQVQQHGQLVQQAADEVQQQADAAAKEKAGADKAKSDLQVAAANLKVQEAQLEAQYEKLKCDLMQREMALHEAMKADSEQGAAEAESEKEAMGQYIQTAIASLDQNVANFINQAQQYHMHMAAMMNKPEKPKIVRIDRQNGSLVPVYESQTQQVM